MPKSVKKLQETQVVQEVAPVVVETVAKPVYIDPVEAMLLGVPLHNVEAMRRYNEDLGADIKVTKSLWAASGVGKTKKRVVLEMLVKGTTKANIVTCMGITPTAAASLFGDLRIIGIKIVRDGDVYSVDRAQLAGYKAFADLVEEEE